MLPVMMGKLLSHQGQPKIRGNFQPTERKLVASTLLYSFTVSDLLGGAPRERHEWRMKAQWPLTRDRY